MSAQENARIARAHYELFNRRDFERSALLIARNARWISVPSGEIFHGLPGYRQFVQNWTIAFPDARMEVTNLIPTDDWVVAEFAAQGTHEGLLTGMTDRVPPTGRQMEMPFCEVLQIRDGKILNARLYFDLATLMRQLGLSHPEGTKSSRRIP